MSKTIDLNINCECIGIDPMNANDISVDIYDVEIENILNQIDIEDVVKHYGENDLIDEIIIYSDYINDNYGTVLDEIGKDVCIDYFDIEESA